MVAIAPSADLTRAKEGMVDATKSGANTGSKGVQRKKPKTSAAEKEKLVIYAKILGVILVFLTAGAVTFEAWVYREECKDNVIGEEPNAEEQHQKTSLRELLNGIGGLSSPYFGTADGWKGRMFVAQLAFFVVLSMFRLYVENNWRQQFWDCFQNGTGAQFRHLMSMFLILVSLGVLLGVYSTYIRWLLYIDWRTHMTQQFVNKWLSAKAFCQVARSGSLDNPDQRLQQDLAMYTQSTVDLSHDLISHAAKFILFVPLLYIYSPELAFGMFHCPGWLLYLVLLYACAGTVGAHHFGKKLIPISFAKQRAEANFRSQLVEVRDHADAIALTNGENQARERLTDQFQTFRGYFWYFMQTNKRLMYFKHIFGFLNWLVPFVILAPSFFSGEITLGQLFQLTHVIEEVQSSMDWLITSYEPLSKWRATADRLLAFETEVNNVSVPDVSTLDGGNDRDVVVASDVTLRVNGKLLWTCPRLDIPTGWVLFVGPQGVGKTCLLKMLAGTWPTDGRVCVSPNRVFIPGDAFVPMGTLREALLYPNGNQYATEHQLRMALADVGLDRLSKGRSLTPAIPLKLKEMVEKFAISVKPGAGAGAGAGSGAAENSSEGEEEWSNVLSYGERQRLTVAQLLLRSPAPDAVFLDGSFSHVDGDCARRLCALLRTRLPKTSFVQVSHDVETMRPHHDHLLEASVHDGVFTVARSACRIP